MKFDFGLDTLLNLNGFESHYTNGYWYKIEARIIECTNERPHGIRYNLTFHDQYGNRIFSMDNKHIPKHKRQGYHGRIVEYDHLHNDQNDKGTPYTFVNAEKLLADFWQRVDKILSEVETE